MTLRYFYFVFCEFLDFLHGYLPWHFLLAFNDVQYLCKVNSIVKRKAEDIDLFSKYKNPHVIVFSSLENF